MENENYAGKECRKPLSAQELDDIKTQLLESIYADIGRSLVKKILWVLGATMATIFAWLAGTGHVQL